MRVRVCLKDMLPTPSQGTGRETELTNANQQISPLLIAMEVTYITIPVGTFLIYTWICSITAVSNPVQLSNSQIQLSSNMQAYLQKKVLCDNGQEQLLMPAVELSSLKKERK